MEKETPIFYSIKDVSKRLGLPSHVLRFWETQFPELKPVQRSGGCRYYRKEDVELISKIQNLLHEQGYTIKGAKAVLAKENFPDCQRWQGEVIAEPTKASQRVVKDGIFALREFVQEVLSKVDK